VWDLIHFALLDWLARHDQIDRSRAVVDSCSLRAVYGGEQTGPNPTDQAKRGSKRHLICEVPLAVRLTGAKRNDSQEALALVDAIPPLHDARGDRGNDPVCSGIAATTRRRFGVGCGRGILCRRSLCVVPREWFGPLAVGGQQISAHPRERNASWISARLSQRTRNRRNWLSHANVRSTKSLRKTWTTA
jgi:hypothetical protein